MGYEIKDKIKVVKKISNFEGEAFKTTKKDFYGNMGIDDKDYLRKLMLADPAGPEGYAVLEDYPEFSSIAYLDNEQFNEHYKIIK